MTEFRITIEKRIIEEDKKSGYFNEIYQQRKEFKDFNLIPIINAFNTEAEKANFIFTVDKAVEKEASDD